MATVSNKMSKCLNQYQGQFTKVLKWPQRLLLLSFCFCQFESVEIWFEKKTGIIHHCVLYCFSNDKAIETYVLNRIKHQHNHFTISNLEFQTIFVWNIINLCFALSIRELAIYLIVSFLFVEEEDWFGRKTN